MTDRPESRPSRPTTRRPTSLPRTSVGWPYAVLVFAVFVTYGQSLGHDFVDWDDDKNVTANPYLAETTWHNVARFWRESYFTRYTPLSYTLYSAQAWLARIPDAAGNPTFSPWVFHAVNLLLHLACVLLVYRLLIVLLGSSKAACLGALLFALHPLQAESVGWVSGQGGLLSAAFSLLALLLYLRCGDRSPIDLAGCFRLIVEPWPGRSRWLWYLAASLAYLAALLAKPSAVCVPVIASVLDLRIPRKSWRTSALLLLPWYLLAIGVYLLTSQQRPGSTVFLPPWWIRPFLAGNALLFYLAKLAWPMGLVIQYPRSPQLVMAERGIYFAWLLPVVLLGLAWRFRSYGPWLLCAGWFVAALAPALGLVRFDYQHFSTVADRYAYLALVAPSLAFAWCFGRSASRGVLAAAGGILLLLSILTMLQVRHWRNNQTLFDYTLSINPHSEVAARRFGARVTSPTPLRGSLAAHR